ncbi:CU044_5270 family protein [Kitasatospora sp. CM 4170]|uniref:CU044_5270 family protein n=1 Tax=Kitasatospora aburaviensis TaxID=67265 RepID=A0ABW1F7E7_9ACTN|nr:CU044_5270 family protein [Kitasatospora sp. CM 4170]WNM49877.1 CU044_5270 family protein [Kitasatospora sp. CM 4170]
MNDSQETLAADRHRLLREHVMSEIAAEAARGTEAKAPRSRRRLVWLVASPVAVGAVAAVTLVVPGGHESGSGPAGPGTPTVSVSSAATTPASPTTSASPSATASASGTASASPTVAPTDAAGLLAQAARAAASRPDPHAKNGQFTYQRLLQDGDLESRRERRMWFSVDGRSEGLIVDPGMPGPQGGDRNPWPAPLGKAEGAPREASFSTQTYAFLASLPTDPEGLLQALLNADRSKMVAGMPMTKELRYQIAFGDVQMAFMNVTAPPAVQAALMQAAAKLPGTSVVADEVDAAGRHGVAVVGMNGTMRVSLIFDTTTGAFLGVREVLLKDLPPVGADGLPPVGEPSPGANKGKGYTHSSAVFEAGIVDHAGDGLKG